jgi:YidC/Oxa1 family membrane protein insertase
MEQKTFLAIVLSFLFLLTYNVLVIEPQQKKKPSNITETIENKEDSALVRAPSLTVTPGKVLPAPKDDAHSPSATLENETFRIDFLTDTGFTKTITAKAYQYTPPIAGILDIPTAKKLLTSNGDQGPFQFVLQEDGLEISKRLVTKDKHTLKGTLNYRNTGSSSIEENAQITLFIIDINQIKNDKEKMRDNMLFEYSVFVDNKVVRKGNAFKFSDKENRTEQKSIGWAGWRDRYHFVAVKPDFQASGYSIQTIDEHRVAINLNIGELKLEPGTEKSFEFTIYTGPQDLQILKGLDGDVHKIMAFSGYGFLDFIEKFIYNVLLVMNKFIPNWGVCIILISILIYAATYPLTLKSMLSMRRMQELQPKMAELREKYKTDPQKLNTEVVQLYRIHNINPLSGCLPILLQMPIFISLYQVLWRTHNFQGADFLWIKDLSAPDKFVTLPTQLPIIGNELNLLPLLMMVVMFLQQKISAKNMIIVDPAQEMQQKMMLFVMPVFIGFIFYHFASGLTLYFTVFYLLSTLTQYKMSKINKVVSNAKK